MVVARSLVSAAAWAVATEQFSGARSLDAYPACVGLAAGEIVEGSLAQRAREHRNRADRADPENERPLDQVTEAALEPGLEPREPYLHLLPQLGDVRPKLRPHIGQITPHSGEIATRGAIARAGIHLMHPIHKLGALLSPDGFLKLLGQPRRDGHAPSVTYARQMRRSISFGREQENASSAAA